MIDFDHQAERLSSVKDEIPQELSDRVFVLGVLSEPEDLKANLRKSLEAIGESLSQDCSDDTRRVWGHDLLKHNEPELDRMVSSVKPFLFNQHFLAKKQEMLSLEQSDTLGGNHGEAAV